MNDNLKELILMIFFNTPGEEEGGGSETYFQ